MAIWVDCGIDCGTTVTKAVLLGDDGRLLAHASRPTRWETPAPGWSERSAGGLGEAVDALLAEVAAAVPDARIRSVGVCSIAETGVLVGDDGAFRHPMMAWHDPRGGDQAKALAPEVAAALPARTGLSVSPVPSLFKLLWLRDEAGVDLRGTRWLGVADVVVRHLGAEPHSERSLLGRTGLHDVHEEAPWQPALDLLGVGPELLPPAVTAGAALGRVRADHPVEAARGAVITLAGMDHLVAAVAVGAGGIGSMCDSMGTGEALTVTLAHPPAPPAVADLVARGTSVHAHVIDGATCVIGGLRSGLVLDHVLTLLGAHSREDRRALDDAARGTPPADGIVLTGLALDDDLTVSASWPEGTPREAVWTGVLERLRAGVESRVRAVQAAGHPLEELYVTGGWAHLGTVLESRRGLLERMRVVDLDEPGAVGSALFGRWAAKQGEGTDPVRQHGPPAGWFATSPS
ncbi:L-fuculokinase [Oryzobacter terrae]|uniref:FGGY-family carbohydrate kinase n=1 Tax=Oryzobacter terrae TaxID=1620385 RepID=UPI00366AC606